MTVKPLGDRVLLEIAAAEEKTKSGIILPDTAQEKPQEAKVIEVGPGKFLENGERGGMSVSQGDRVLFGKYSGTEIKVDGHEYLMIREDEILAILK
jgi:chaperonin GroES